jgi:hypothetical protein
MAATPRNARRATLLALLVVAAAAGCGRDEGSIPQVQQIPADDTVHIQGAELDPASPPEQRLTVINPFDEPLEIFAEVDGRAQQLGVVGPSTRGDFFVQAGAGAEITLEARDTAGRALHREALRIDPGGTAWTLSRPPS